MNKRANLYLNIYEFLSFLLALTCIGLSLTLKELPYQIPFILKSSSLFLGTLFGAILVLIEVLLFLLMKKKFKVFYLLFLMSNILLGILITKKFAFYGIFVFFLFALLKNILRIKLVEKIYIPKKFNEYCKIFNIKIPDFKKKKEVKEEILEKPITIKVEKKKLEEKKSKSEKKSSTKKSTTRKKLKVEES